jgi:hypothetical protein
MGYLRKKNGVTVYGPSQILINSGGTLNVSVSNVEKVLTSLTVPANTFVTGDCINIISRIVKTTTNGITEIRMRIGTTGTISDTLVGSYSATSATHTIIPIFRTLSYYGGFSDANLLMSPTNNLASIDVTGDSIITTVSIDWTTSQIVTVSGINAISGTDSMNGMFIKTKVI